MLFGNDLKRFCLQNCLSGPFKIRVRVRVRRLGLSSVKIRVRVRVRVRDTRRRGQVLGTRRDWGQHGTGDIEASKQNSYPVLTFSIQCRPAAHNIYPSTLCLFQLA